MTLWKKLRIIWDSPAPGYFIGGMLFINGLEHAAAVSWWVLLDFALMYLCVRAANRCYTYQLMMGLKVGHLKGLHDALEIAEKADAEQKAANALGKD